MARALTPALLAGLVACAASPQQTERKATPREQCDAFRGCPAGRRCLLGKCEPIDCRAALPCTEIGLCSLQGAECEAATDADCRSAAVCRRLGLCRAVSGVCAADAPEGCSHPGACDPSGLCVCPLQRNVGAKPEGPLPVSTEAVKLGFRSGVPGMRTCFERAARHIPDLAGMLVLDMTIASDGTVSRARYASLTAPSVDLALCVLEQVRTLTFRRAPGEPIQIRYPLIFRSSP